MKWTGFGKEIDSCWGRRDPYYRRYTKKYVFEFHQVEPKWRPNQGNKYEKFGHAMTVFRDNYDEI